MKREIGQGPQRVDKDVQDLGKRKAEMPQNGIEEMGELTLSARLSVFLQSSRSGSSGQGSFCTGSQGGEAVIGFSHARGDDLVGDILWLGGKTGAREVVARTLTVKEYLHRIWELRCDELQAKPSMREAISATRTVRQSATSRGLQRTHQSRWHRVGL